jgi:hypothetical protein
VLCFIGEDASAVARATGQIEKPAGRRVERREAVTLQVDVQALVARGVAGRKLVGHEPNEAAGIEGHPSEANAGVCARATEWR